MGAATVCIGAATLGDVIDLGDTTLPLGDEMPPFDPLGEFIVFDGLVIREDEGGDDDKANDNAPFSFWPLNSFVRPVLIEWFSLNDKRRDVLGDVSAQYPNRS